MADRSLLRAEELQAFINIRAILLDVIRHLEAGDLDSNMIDALYFRLDWLHGLRTVPTIVIAHTFCASPDTRISYHQCLLIQGYFCTA